MIRTTTALFAATLLAACAANGGQAPQSGATEPAPMRTIATGTSTTMQHGETLRLSDGASLTYVGVLQDSRCPPNARCIRAGDADIEFAYAIEGGPTAPVKPNLPEAPSKNMGPWQLTVLDLEFNEHPAVTVRVTPAQ